MQAALERVNASLTRQLVRVLALSDRAHQERIRRTLVVKRDRRDHQVFDAIDAEQGASSTFAGFLIDEFSRALSPYILVELERIGGDHVTRWLARVGNVQLEDERAVSLRPFERQLSLNPVEGDASGRDRAGSWWGARPGPTP